MHCALTKLGLVLAGAESRSTGSYDAASSLLVVFLLSLMRAQEVDRGSNWMSTSFMYAFLKLNFDSVNGWHTCVWNQGRADAYECVCVCV